MPKIALMVCRIRSQTAVFCFELYTACLWFQDHIMGWNSLQPRCKYHRKKIFSCIQWPNYFIIFYLYNIHRQPNLLLKNIKTKLHRKVTPWVSKGKRKKGMQDKVIDHWSLTHCIIYVACIFSFSSFDLLFYPLPPASFSSLLNLIWLQRHDSLGHDTEMEGDSSTVCLTDEAESKVKHLDMKSLSFIK